MSLIEAIKNSDNDKAMSLLQQGADPNQRSTDGPPPADGGATALLLAIRNFDIKEDVIVEMLKRGADPNLADTYDQETPLQAFARTYPYGSADNVVLNQLLDKGANPELQNRHGDTALHVAASAGAGLICVYLIKRGAKHQTKDRKGKTLLDIAPDVATRSSIEEALGQL